MENPSFGVCKISTASIRRYADHQSIMLSQALFGERVELIKRKNKHWYKIKCKWDGLEGWVDPKQFYFTEDTKAISELECRTFALEHLHGVTSNNNTIPIGIGSNLYNCDGINVKMTFGKFQYSGQIMDLDQSEKSRKLLINIARRFMHSPYFFGGRSISGTDSSGFIQLAMKMIGIKMPRFTDEMAKLGEDIGFISEALPGDLAFFGKNNQEISHMGLLLEDQHILHVFGKVKADKLDHHGIFDLETGVLGQIG